MAAPTVAPTKMTRKTKRRVARLDVLMYERFESSPSLVVVGRLLVVDEIGGRSRVVGEWEALKAETSGGSIIWERGVRLVLANEDQGERVVGPVVRERVVGARKVVTCAMPKGAIARRIVQVEKKLFTFSISSSVWLCCESCLDVESWLGSRWVE
jgi:hypothetical protein